MENQENQQQQLNFNEEGSPSIEKASPPEAFSSELKEIINKLNTLMINTQENIKIKLFKEILKTFYNTDKIKTIDKDLLNEYLNDVKPKKPIKQHKEETEEQKEKHKEQMRQWRATNKDKIKEWKEANKENLKEYRKEYAKNNKDKFKEYQKKYYDNHPDKLEEMKAKKRILSKEYYNKNKTKVLAKLKTKYNANKLIKKNKKDNKEEIKENENKQHSELI